MPQELDVKLRDSMQELFHQKEYLQTVKMKEKDSIAQVSKSKSTLNHLNSQLGKLEKELQKQQATMVGQARWTHTLKYMTVCCHVYFNFLLTLVLHCVGLGDIHAEQKTGVATR